MGVFHHFRLPRLPLALLVGLLFLKASVASAGLLGDPPSYVVASPDGKYVLVMLGPEYDPVLFDEGETQAELDEAKLPDGRTINLREEFPESGLYRLESKELIWRTSFRVRPRSVAMSEDGQYWVFYHWFAFRNPECTNWAVRFFGPKGLIKSYSGTDLIDYPFLLQLTDRGHYWEWVDRGGGDDLKWGDRGANDGNDPEIRDGVFYLRTLTSETYEFDVTTGNILRETHFWKPLVRWGLGFLTLLLGILGWGVYRYWHWCRLYLSTPSLESERATCKSSFNFSVRQLLGATTVVAIGCCIYRFAPFVLPLLIALGLTIALGRRLFFAMKQCHWYFNPIRFAGLLVCFLAALLAAYILSLGPVLAFSYERDIAPDTWRAIVFPYYPAWMFPDIVAHAHPRGICRPLGNFLVENREAWIECFSEWRK